MNSQIQNRRILGFGATPHRNKKTGSQEGKTGQGNQEKQQHPERRSAGTHSAAVVPDHVPNFLSLVRRNSYTISSSLLRARHAFLDPFSSTIAKLLTNCTAAACCVPSSCLHCGPRQRSCCFVQGNSLYTKR